MIKFAIGYTVGFGVYLLMTTVVPLFVVDINPSKSLRKNVMVGKHQEVVAVLLIPIGDHLGIFLSIGPE